MHRLACFSRLPHCRAQRRHHLVQVADDGIVGMLNDGRVGIDIDRQDVLGGLAADHVLDGAADAAGDVDFGRDARAGLAHLVEVRES